jgi:hypothetical protein
MDRPSIALSRLVLGKVQGLIQEHSDVATICNIVSIILHNHVMTLPEMTIGFLPQEKKGSPGLLPKVTPPPEEALAAASLSTQYTNALRDGDGPVQFQFRGLRGVIMTSHLPQKVIEVCQKLEEALNPLIRAFNQAEREAALKALFPVLISERAELGALTSLAAKLHGKGASSFAVEPPRRSMVRRERADFVGSLAAENLPTQSFRGLLDLNTSCEQFCCLASILGAQNSLTPDEWIRLTSAAVQFKADTLKSIAQFGRILVQKGGSEAADQELARFEEAVQGERPPPNSSKPTRAGPTR